jgi:hypothetical protein
VTTRLPCPPAPGPLEAYATRFDPLFGSLAQRRGFRTYLAGLLLPRERNKTLTCLAGVEPVVGAQHPAVQRLQFFLSESTWDHEQVNARRLELLLADPVTAPHGAGVLVIDDAGDGKDGTATAHLGRQWPGRLGKTDRGLVTVTTLWADERCSYPRPAMPYTPAHPFPKGRTDPAFRTKLQLGVALAGDAPAAGVAFRAVVADSADGDQDTFRGELATAGLVLVLASSGAGAGGPTGTRRTPLSMLPGRWPGWPRQSRRLDRGGPHLPRRTHRHLVAADAQLGWWGPDGTTRLVVATTDPAALPETSTRYLATNLPRPGSPMPPTAPPARRPGRARAALRDQELDRAERQAGQGRIGVGRLPGPLRCRHPSPPDPGQLRLLFLLAGHRRCRLAATQPQPGLGTDPGGPPDPKPEAAQPAVATAAPGARRSSPSALDSRHDLAGRVRSGAGLADPSTVLQHWWQAWSKAPRRPNSKP